eukprot:9477348-Pyramimonas_sp.AAC.1
MGAEPRSAKNSAPSRASLPPPSPPCVVRRLRRAMPGTPRRCFKGFARPERLPPARGVARRLAVPAPWNSTG